MECKWCGRNIREQVTKVFFQGILTGQNGVMWYEETKTIRSGNYYFIHNFNYSHPQDYIFCHDYQGDNSKLLKHASPLVKE